MLLGKPCVAAAAVVPGDVALATQRLRTMRFVGLFEDWATSVCLFHRALRLPAPSKAEVADVRRGPKAPAGPARDPRDWADLAVYAAAAHRFAATLRAHGGSATRRVADARCGGGAAAAEARRATPRRPTSPSTAPRPPRSARRAADGFWGRLPATWAFLERDAAPWAGRPSAGDAAFHRPWDPLRRGLRVTTYRGRLYAAYAEDRELPRGSNAPRADRQWLLPSFDTFRLEGGDVDDVAPAAARERSGAFWRGTVRGFRGYSAEAMVARRFRLTNLNHDPSAANPHALAEPYDARVQFSGGVGNWRRWTVTTACDAGDDRLDAAAAAGAGPASFKLLNYGFGDHGAICAKEALLYLDGISTSNGLKYYLACGAPVLMDRASRFEDLITAAWPMVAGGNLTEGVDYVAVGAAADDVRADERTRAAAEKRFCGDVAAAVDGLRRNPADAAAMGARAPRRRRHRARGLEYLAGGSGTRSVVSLLRAAGALVNGRDTNDATNDAAAMRDAGMDDFDRPADGVLDKLLPAVGSGGFLFDRAAFPAASRRRELAALCAFSLNMSAVAREAAATGRVWGWKEPRAFFYLNSWGVAFPKFRFLHVARDVRTVGTTHLEGSLDAWRLYWRRGARGPRRAARRDRWRRGRRGRGRRRRGAVLVPAPLPRRPPLAPALRAILGRRAARRRRAGPARAGPLPLARIEDLSGGAACAAAGAEKRGCPADSGDAGAAHADDLLRWVFGDAHGERTIGDKLETWRATFGGHEASYRHAKPVCDLLVKASFGDLTRGHFKSERMKDGSLRVQMQGARNKVAAFLDYAGGLPAKDAHKLPVSDLISSAHLRKDRGLGPRVAAVAAVKSQCYAVSAAANALQRAAPGVGAALAALGYPPDASRAPSMP
ncbi:hypothetical protein JL720_6943 [Aureococcus anophagefferens]|nr:hypothetical protein JL720_6943 [Aureococcus anophagefferens]